VRVATTQSEITLELVGIPESAHLIHRRDKGDRRHGAHPRHCHQPSRALVFVTAFGHVGVEIGNLPIERIEEREHWCNSRRQ
jgi:hypothetical protein